MDDLLDTLFARFRREKDPELLAEVFDRTAPRLLRLAIHLAGDPSEAEDLVQATFVTAIERAPSFDGSRPLVPWLLGILANHARSSGRKEQRAPDIDRLIAREQESPLEEAQRAEISGALAKAIDDLPEPYRQTLTLRLRHGMKPADIAHVLGKSPGAVRVRIHRGLEMLREKLPAGFAASAFWFVPRMRGLAAVRHVVVAKAAAAVPAASGSGAIGGVIVSKKLVGLGIAAALLLLASVGVKTWLSDPGRIEPTGRTEIARPEARTRAQSESLASIELPQARADERRAEGTAGSGNLPTLHVRVVEGSTDRPIPGARIEVFSSRRARYADVVRRWSERIEVNADGTFTALEDTWPWLPAQLSDLARAGREDVEVCDAPLPGAPAIAEGSSDADGMCDLAVGGARFFRCSAPGYEDRLFAPRERESTIRMWKPGRLAGYLIDTSGNRIHEKVRLRFWGRRDRPPGESAPDDWAGQWIVETDADGAFDAQLAADHVHASAVDPGWMLTNVGINPDNGQRWVFVTSFAPGKETEPARLVATRQAVLTVVDAESQAPIESFSLFFRELANGYPRWSGRYVAPGGKLRMPEGTSGEITVWSDHHVPKTVRDGSGRVELARGEPPRLEGVVRDAAGPKSGVVASVLGVGPLQWSESDQHLLDAVSTDSEGRFSLVVPEGEWMLRCSSAGVCSCRLVQVPSAGPVVVDLAAGASITVRVRDTAGVARPAHAVVLHGAKGRQEWKETDERGEVEFRALSADEYSVHVPKRPTKSSFSGGELAQVALLDDERKTVDITVPVYDPRFARLIANPPVAFEGWRAVGVLSGTWTAIEEDGRIPVDLQENVTELMIESRDATRWLASIPENAPDGYMVRIDLAGRGYEGVLRDRANGSPLGRVRVVARPVDRSGHDGISPSVISGFDGAFRLTGLADARYELSFQPADDSNPRANRSGILFYPSAHPADPAVHLELELPRRDTGQGFEGMPSHVVSGHVRVAGAARQDLSMNVASVIPSDQGTLHLYPESAWCRVNDVGGYTVTIPFAPRHEVHVWDRTTTKGFAMIVWDGSSFQPEEEVRDIELAE
jgi:RNA polymerase sigma-70 factor (ECF subfamily)